MTWLNIPTINNSVRNTINPSDYSVTKLIWDGPAYGKIANIGKYYINSGSDAVPAVQALKADIERYVIVSSGSNDNPVNVSQISALRFNKKHVICGDDFVNIFNLDWQNSQTGTIPQDHIFVTKDISINGTDYTGSFDLDNYVYKFVCNFNMTNLNANSKDWMIWRQAIGGGLRLYFTKGVNSPVAGGIENGNNIKFLAVSQGLANQNSGVSAAPFGMSLPTGPIDIHANTNNNFSNPVINSSAAASYLTLPICASQSSSPAGAVTAYLVNNSRCISGAYSSINNDIANVASVVNNNAWRNNIINSTISKINPAIASSILANGFLSNEITALSSMENSTTNGKDQIYNINDYSSNFNIDPINHFSFDFFICKEYFNEYSNDMRSSASIASFSTVVGNNALNIFVEAPKYTHSLFREAGTGKFQFPFMSFVFINTNAKPATPAASSNVSLFHGNQPFTKHFIGAVNTADNASPNTQQTGAISEADIFSFPQDMIKNIEMNIIRIKR